MAAKIPGHATEKRFRFFVLFLARGENNQIRLRSARFLTASNVVFAVLRTVFVVDVLFGLVHVDNMQILVCGSQNEFLIMQISPFEHFRLIS